MIELPSNGEGQRSQTRWDTTLQNYPFILGSGFAQIMPSWEFLELMSEYLGLLLVNINLEGWVSFSDRYRSRPDSLMGKSYGDFREMDENMFFHEGALFRTFFTIFALYRPVFSNKGFPPQLRIV